MKAVHRMPTLLVAAGIMLAACAAPTAKPPATPPPVTVEKTAGSELARVTLSQKAADRLGLQTAAVEAEQVSGGVRTVIPYAAVLYDAKGSTWAYTNPEGLVFVRAAITIDGIQGDRAILTGGPTAGTKIVTVGGPELYGAETGVGGGH
jgi:hypothetical protein